LLRSGFRHLWGLRWQHVRQGAAGRVCVAVLVPG
jgi:hypothetical protein